MEVLFSVIMKVVSVFLLVVFMLSVTLLILTFRKPRKVSIVSQLITIAISLTCLLIFSLLINYYPPVWLWLLMVMTGAGLGIVWSRSTRVFIHGQTVMSQNSIWYLVVWGGLFALNQMIIIVTNRPPAIAMAMLIMSTAVVWGTNGSIMVRYVRLRPATGHNKGSMKAREASEGGPSSARTASTGTPDRPPPGLRQDRTGTRVGFCSQCGTRAEKEDRFCRGCGTEL